MKVLSSGSGWGELGFFSLEQSGKFSFHLPSSSRQKSGSGGRTIPTEWPRALGWVSARVKTHLLGSRIRGLHSSFPFTKSAAQNELDKRDPGSAAGDGLAKLACRLTLLPLPLAALQGSCLGGALPLITGIDQAALLLLLVS